MQTKICTRCEREQPITEYYAASPGSRYPDGHVAACRTCLRAAAKDKRRDDPDYLRSYGRTHKVEAKQWLADHPGYMAAAVKFYRVKPSSVEKIRARYSVKLALRDGLLIRPDRCQSCGGSNGGKAMEAHHDDYGLPLSVVWLCRDCHGIAHRKILAAQGEHNEQLTNHIEAGRQHHFRPVNLVPQWIGMGNHRSMDSGNKMITDNDTAAVWSEYARMMLGDGHGYIVVWDNIEMTE